MKDGGADLTETTHRPLFWQTCQALIADFSINNAAMGENRTGGKFS